MKKLVILMLLTVMSFTVVGCYGTGPCHEGVCNEEYSKEKATPPASE